MRCSVGKLASLSVVLLASLVACITHEPPPGPLPASSPSSNGLNDDEVQWYIHEGFHELRSCMADTPAAETNQATLHVSISESGSVSTAELVETNFRNPSVLPCLQDHLRRIRFPARNAATTSTIELIFLGT